MQPHERPLQHDIRFLTDKWVWGARNPARRWKRDSPQ